MHTNRTIAVTARQPCMTMDRKAAVWIGVLYIIGTVAFVLSALVTGSCDEAALAERFVQSRRPRVPAQG